MLAITANVYKICSETMAVFQRDRNRLSRRLTRSRDYLAASTSTGIRNNPKALRDVYNAQKKELDHIQIVMTCLQKVRNNRHELVGQRVLPSILREPVATLAWMSYSDPRLKVIRTFLLKRVMFFHADVENQGIKDIAMRRSDAFVDSNISGRLDIPSPPSGSDDEEPPSPPSSYILPAVPRECPGAPMKTKFALIR